MENNFTVERANDYIKNNEIDKQFYPKFNFAAPIGWINDPNGVSIYNDELHLFYQHYPYDSIHGKMHWGHAKSKDGYNWEHLDVALAPDQSYDKDGVFSGSAIEKDGKLYLMYTGHVVDSQGDIEQNQNIAVSEDGVNFEKYKGNPVIDKNNVPEGSSISDFRDPKVFIKDNKYYAVIGSKTVDDKGQVLLYESDDLIEWSYKSVILPYNDFLGDMVECPDLILFEEKDVFLLSAMNYTDKETGEYYPHITWMIEGKVNWDTFIFDVESTRKMDGGFDYYAPQTTLTTSNPNEYVAIAWKQAWDRSMPPHDQRHQWTGQMTIPRLLKEKNGQITQTPLPEIMSEVSIKETFNNVELEESKTYEFKEEYIEFTMSETDKINLSFLNNDDEKVTLNFDGERKTIDFSRKETITISDSDDKIFDELNYKIPSTNDIWEVKIFIDTSSIQIFINDYYTLTSTYYTNNPLNTLKLESENSTVLESLKKGSLSNEEEK